MVRHISAFTFKNVPEKAENIAKVKAFLETVPAQYPAIKAQFLGTHCSFAPEMPPESPVLFADLIQVADMETVDDANGYPQSQAHIALSEFSSDMLTKVTVIDFEM